MSHERGRGNIRVRRSNESRNESAGYRGIMVGTRRTAKTVPHQSLIMLKIDGSNITSWENAMIHHLEANFGALGSCISNNALLVRPFATAQMIATTYAGHNAESI